MKIDPNKVYKGACFSEEEIEQISGVSVDDREFWKAALQVREGLEATMRRKGDPCAVRFVNGCLMVLVDAAQHGYGMAVMRQALRKLRRGFEYVKTTNPRFLNDHQKESWLKNLEISSRLYQSAATTSQRIKVEYVARGKRSPV